MELHFSCTETPIIVVFISSMQRRIQPYPSPTSTQNHHTASPFFTQHGNDAAPLPDGLQQLRDHDPSRTDGASYGGTALMGTAAESAEQFAPQPPMIDGNGQQQVSAEHLAQNVLTIEQQQRQPTSEQSSSRRKPKTSKACDECRRKKVSLFLRPEGRGNDSPQIRCDITTDNPTNPCSACRRSGSVCQFSRQQLKRGPSKGSESYPILAITGILTIYKLHQRIGRSTELPRKPAGSAAASVRFRGVTICFHAGTRGSDAGTDIPSTKHITT